jgi:dienelactone hydrolase
LTARGAPSYKTDARGSVVVVDVGLGARVAAGLSSGLSSGLGLAAELALRGAALPGVLGLRWAGRALAPKRDGMPCPERSAALAAKVALDEIFFATEATSAVLSVGRSEWRRVQREVEAAHELYERRGWLADPAAYHRTPPPLREVREQRTSLAGRSFDQLSFESGYAPWLDEPGDARWEHYRANQTAHAWLLRHAGPPRPWIVCVPGYRMGHPGVDFAGFRARWAHRALGVNVAIFVMPFHGPRTSGRRGGDGYLSGDFLDTIHAQAQAVWDLRRLIGWLRREGAPAVGVHGVSLGGYTAALLTALEPDLQRVVLGIPAACFVDLARANVPPALLQAAEWLGFPLARIGDVLRVVSPLAMPPRVPRDRLSIYAGISDRLAPPHHAWDLWRHWQRPRVVWYQGSHVSFLLEPAVRELLRETLHARTLLEAVEAPAPVEPPAPSPAPPLRWAADPLAPAVAAGA